MGHEADLLRRRVDQGELPPGVADREGQPRETRPRAHVGDPLTDQVRVDREAVEEVMRDHRPGLTDGREVVAAIPAAELIEQSQEANGILRRQRHPEAGRGLAQRLDRTRVARAFRSPSGLTFGKPVHHGATDHTLRTVRLLLVEDDAMIGEAVRAGLKREGFTVDWVHEAGAAAQALASEPFDLLLLDLGLPGTDGLELLKSLRARGEALPVLIITARDAVSDRVQGLDAGADDYLTKPFDLDELAARIRALLRRRSGRAVTALEHLGVVLDPASHRVTQQGVEIALSPREFALLQLLMERPGTILSRAQIEERLYGWGEEVESNAVEVHIHGLRRKLGAQFILTVRGVGYRVRPHG